MIKAVAAFKASKTFALLWMFAVLASVVLALPLLAFGSLFLLSSVGLHGLGGSSFLDVLVGILWPAGGAAGLAGLLAARWGAGSVRTVRVRQALLLAGIAAAAPPLFATAWMTFAGSATVGPLFASAFAVLTVQGAADIVSLQGRAAMLTGRMPTARPIAPLFLGVAALSALAALGGNIALGLFAR